MMKSLKKVTAYGYQVLASSGCCRQGRRLLLDGEYLPYIENEITRGVEAQLLDILL